MRVLIIMAFLFIGFRATAADFSFQCKLGDKAKCIEEFNETTKSGEKAATVCGVNDATTTCKGDNQRAGYWRCRVRGSSCVELGESETVDGQLTFPCSKHKTAKVVYVKRKEWAYLSGKYRDVERASFCIDAPAPLSGPESQATSPKAAQ